MASVGYRDRTPFSYFILTPDRLAKNRSMFIFALMQKEPKKSRGKYASYTLLAFLTVAALHPRQPKRQFTHPPARIFLRPTHFLFASSENISMLRFLSHQQQSVPDGQQNFLNTRIFMDHLIQPHQCFRVSISWFNGFQDLA